MDNELRLVVVTAFSLFIEAAWCRFIADDDMCAVLLPSGVRDDDDNDESIELVNKSAAKTNNNNAFFFFILIYFYSNI